jgi:hypothetical protein
LGKRIKVFKIGEVIKLGAERHELRERAGIIIIDLRYDIPFGDFEIVTNDQT